MVRMALRPLATALVAGLIVLASLPSATLAGSGNRPVHGTIVGGADVAMDLTCPIGMRTLSWGTGEATHLGLATMQSSHCTPNPPFGPAPGPIVGGQMTITAANGDVVHATYSGTVDPIDMVEGASLSGLTHFIVTGGTGRFADATGHGDMAFQGTLHLASPMTITWTLTGSLGY